MISLLRLRFKKIFCWLLLMQLVNLSISPARQHLQIINGQATYLEDLTVNNIESIYEFVQERFFKKDVPEKQDVHDQAQGKIFVSISEPKEVVFTLVPIEYCLKHNHSYIESVYECFPSLDSPPPEFII